MSVFQEISEDKILHRSEHFFLIYDGYPVSDGHILIITKKFKKDLIELDEIQRNELPLMIDKAKSIIEETRTPDAYNIGMNCGEAAGQTVFHFHCHVIPRYNGDMKKPRGGVRHCIPSKGNY
jgi:diadenosine tetraphosphate (Ap4A) HIT family hydrolase